MKKILLLCSSILFTIGQLLAQDQLITGKVTDATEGSSIPGVSVTVKGTTRGSITDAQGAYSISVPTGGQTLVFSFVGYRTTEIQVAGQSTINVSLQSDTRQLNEVVVTAQGISRDKKSLGYATASISSEELGQNTNPINALQGKVAGLNITAGSNGPGSSSRIVLRGPTSFTGTNQPIFVIDGIPMSNDNNRNDDALNNQVDYGNRGNDINPDDIESISVLKGPAAAALYGSIASNGAIMITTKKGKKNGSTAVNFSTGMQFSSILKLPDFQNEYGQGDVDFLKDDRRENFSWGLPFDGKERPWGQVINGKQKLKIYEALPNNVKDFFNIGKTLTNSLSISGGTEKTNYYVSLNTLNNKGVVPTTTYNKYGIRFSGSSEFSSKFSSNISVGYTRIDSKLPLGGQGNSVYSSVIQQPRDISIVDLKDLSDPFNGTFVGSDGVEYYGYYGGYTKNPYFLLENFKNTNKVDRVTGNIALNYKPIVGLTITERIGADIYSDRRFQKFAKYSYKPVDPSYAGNDQNYNGKYGEDVINYSQINHDLMVSYEKTIAETFGLKFLVGNNIRKTVFSQLRAATNTSGGLIVKDYYNLENSNGPVVSSNTLEERALVGFYGEANLSYKNFAFIGVTARNDISSTLPLANRSYFYPSVNGSFVFSEFLGKASKILSFGKLRANWASVGADAPPYRLNTTYSLQSLSGSFGETVFPLNDIPAFTRNNRIGNNKLKPEFTKSFEVGTELGFLQNKINLDVTYFITRSTNQIISVPQAPSSGYTQYTFNAGDMKNTGLEVTLRATPIQSASGFKLDVFGTFTKVKNEVLSINDGVNQVLLGGFSGMSIVAAVGRPYGTFYTEDYKRDPATGNVVVDNETGLPLVGENAYFGSYLPDYQASFGTTLSYKGLTLNMLFDTKQGGYFYSATKDGMDFVGTAKETTQNGRQPSIYPNSVIEVDGKYVPNTSVTFNPYTYYTNNINASQHLIDASYVKFREASLTYVLPAVWVKKTPFNALSVSVYGNNLFIWTPEENQYNDPEINSEGSSNTQGFEYYANPSLRNYGFRLNVSF